LTTSLALALPVAAQAATPTLKEVLGASGLTASGYVDAGYNYMSADTGGSLRVFDIEHSEFNLHQVATFLAYQPKEGAGVFVNLTAGEDADLIASFGSGSADNFDVTQAFAQYAAGPLTLMAGKYVTLNGAEVIDSRGVPNASRGILFGYAIPFTHTGVRGTLAAGPVTLYAGLNNGWDQLDDTNKGKTGELGVGFGAGPLSVFASGYAGKELGDTGIDGLRTIADVVLTLKAGDMLTFIVNADYGAQEDAIALDDNAEWLGVAGYVNAQFTPKFRGSLRAEWFNDKDGFRTDVNSAGAGTGAGGHEWREVTLTLGQACDEHLDLLFEVRADQSSETAFLEDGVPTDENSSVNLKALYKF
jgi:hypothetical protein